MSSSRLSEPPASIRHGESPLWFKDAIIYEIPIRAFCDSNADGIGDIPGLISKLDYLTDLGVTALWLLPFYPSPLLDGGYDIADYHAVHPAHGTLDDFRRLLDEAHRRGLRIITELVINHTSKLHPWFQRSRRACPGEPWRDFYVWSDDPKKYRDARIIFKDFETSNWTWDPEAKAYYWHRFYSHQPDLNFDNPEVHRAVFEAMDFWFEMGVDGMRLDAIPYLYEREGTTCENLPETHAFLKKLRAHIDSKFKDRMLLAEANQWPEDAAAYFGDGDECHMNFHFPLMPRMFMAAQLEDRFPVVDILNQTPQVPNNCQWATFLRNHDELTLEMVTDEDRDYMYKVYAEDPSARINLGIRRRLAPLLKTREQIELMNSLLFSLPGTPVLYYGDEIGMGDNIYLGDRDGVRTPMQWTADRNAGFSTANPQKLFLPLIADPDYRYETINVEAQQSNPASLLWWMKRLIDLRKQYPALGKGSLEFLHPDNAHVLAFLRELGEERLLIVANLSRRHQWVGLDLPQFVGLTPIEVSGRVPFPPIENRPYVVSLAPHGFIWFSLERVEGPLTTAQSAAPLTYDGAVETLWRGRNKRALERVLGAFIRDRRWFRSKDRATQNTLLAELLPLGPGGDELLALVEIAFTEGDPELYAVPLLFASGAKAQELEERAPHALIARLENRQAPKAPAPLLFDGLATGETLRPLLQAFVNPEELRSATGRVSSFRVEDLAGLLERARLPSQVPELEQTNSTIVLGEELLFKLYRRVDSGTNPETEIGQFLASAEPSVSVPRILGTLEYESSSGQRASLGLLQEFVKNEGTAWDLTLARLEAYLSDARVLPPLSNPPGSTEPRPREATEPPRALSVEAAVESTRTLTGPFLQQVDLLGRRAGELHLALASPTEDPAFSVEPFSVFHQQSIYQRAHGMLARTFGLLGRARLELPELTRELLGELLPREAEIDRRLRRMLKRKFDVVRTRCHGDLHLGQILYTGQDFVLIDFEGEPARPLNERRYKRSPLRDVMGLLRSFNYAAESALRSGRHREEDLPRLVEWARAWEREVRGRFLDAYLETTRGAPFLPSSQEELDALLEFFELEKVIYEIQYEMKNRPQWLDLPLRGLLTLLERP